MCEVVDLHLALETIRCDCVWNGHYSGVQNQAVELRFLGDEILCRFYDGVEGGIVHNENVEVGVRVCLFDFGDCCIGLGR